METGLSTTHHKELREALKAIEVRGAGAGDVRAALYKASLTLKIWLESSEAFRQAEPPGPAHGIIDASEDVLQAFIDWAEGDGKKFQQVLPMHLDMCNELLGQIGTLLTGAGLGLNRLKPEGYNEGLRRLAILSRGIRSSHFSERFAEPFDENDGLLFIQSHWPSALFDLARVIGTGEAPRDPTGAHLAYRFAKLSAILNAGGILEPAQSK